MKVWTVVVGVFARQSIIKGGVILETRDFCSVPG